MKTRSNGSARPRSRARVCAAGPDPDVDLVAARPDAAKQSPREGGDVRRRSRRPRPRPSGGQRLGHGQRRVAGEHADLEHPPARRVACTSIFSSWPSTCPESISCLEVAAGAASAVQSCAGSAAASAASAGGLRGGAALQVGVEAGGQVARRASPRSATRRRVASSARERTGRRSSGQDPDRRDRPQRRAPGGQLRHGHVVNMSSPAPPARGSAADLARCAASDSTSSSGVAGR